jgi:hypothetical protein
MASIPMRDLSLLRVISVGTVAENKELDSDKVEIVLSEQRSFLDGEIKSDFSSDTAKGVDASGKAFEVTVHMCNTINAEWIGDGTNRISAPDVRRGDRVEVLQYAEVDRFFWRALPTTGSSVRKLETVVHAYSNTQDENDNSPTAANSWHSEVNTHSKVWTLAKTNKNDGEAYAYIQQIDAKAGNVVLSADDVGNYVQMNSKDSHIEIANASGSQVSVNKRVITLSADTIILDAKKMIQMNSASAEVKIAETNWTGNTKMTGNLSMTGGISVEGGGSFTVNSNADFQSGINHQGVDIGKDHKHQVYGTNSISGIVVAG